MTRYARTAPRSTAWMSRPASEAALGFARNLIADRVLTDLDEFDAATVAAIRAERPVNGGPVSRLIDSLKSAARVSVAAPRATTPESSVPAGRYALPQSDGGIAFVQVDRPKKGAYAGRVFVVRLLGAPGDFRQIRQSRTEQARILAALEADTLHDVFTDDDDTVTVQDLTGPRAAAVRFSRHFTCCAACMSPLSDTLSRQRGLGPVCWSRY